MMRLLGAMALAGVCTTASAAFAPFEKAGQTTESHTGLWFGAWMTTPDPLLPIETVVHATKEAVTGGVALKVIARPDSIGRIIYEHGLGSFSPPGLTFCVKASKNVTMRVFRPGKSGTQTFSATTSWQKIDITTGTVDWLLSFELDGPAAEETWYILDRIGLEDSFTALDVSGATTGPDDDVSTSQLVLGAGNVSATSQKLANVQPFKIVSLGDSVVAGAQIDLGNGYGWDATQEERFKFSSVLGQILEGHYGYTSGALEVHNFGHGGWTAQQAIDSNLVATEVLSEAGPGDLVILEFGGNDINGGATVAQWKTRMKTLIDECQAGGVTQIVVMGITTADVTIANASAISAALAQIVSDENVAAVDVTEFSTFRGDKYAWAYLANTFHPDASAHMFIGKMTSTLFTGEHFNVVSLTEEAGAGALAVALGASSVSEADGAVSGTVSVAEPVGQDLVVSLSSDDTSEATVPATVTIPASQSSAPFTVTVVNDDLVDGAQVVTVTADASGYEGGAATLTVQDEDTDTDGLPDDWEREHFSGLSPGYADDPDSDGLTNGQEFDEGTDPDNPDTDGDGIRDGDDPSPLKPPAALHGQGGCGGGGVDAALLLAALWAIAKRRASSGA